MTEPSAQEQWLSPAAYERLQQEYDRLVNEGRPEVSQQIKLARAHGDLSENAEYHAAKDRQGLMEARIRELEHVLKTAMVVDPSQQPAGVVKPGTQVTILREGTGGEETYLVGSSENRGEGIAVVSPASPLGSALLDRGVGESVTYSAPVGEMTVKILSVQPYQG